MPIGISNGTIRHKKGTLKVEDKIKKIVQTYGTVFFLTQNGMLSGFGVNNSVQIAGSFLLEANLEGSKVSVGGGLDTVYHTANYVSAWDLIQGGGATSNSHYIYFPSPNDYIMQTRQQSYAALSAYQKEVIDFDAGYTINYDDTKNYKSSVLKNFSLMVLKNGKLLGWGYNTNLELGVDSDTTKSMMLPSASDKKIWENNWLPWYPTKRPLLDVLHKSLDKLTVFVPKQLNTSTNWKSVVANNIGDNYKHILLNSNGEIYTFGGDLNSPQKLGSSSDWKYISYDYAINNSDELYRLRTTISTSLTSAIMFSGYSRYTTSTSYLSSYETLIDVLSSNLKEVILESGVYDNNQTNLYLYLFENGKLYASGSNIIYGSQKTILDSSNYNPNKLISIDEIIGESIKAAYQCCDAYFAITNSNILYYWGSNYNTNPLNVTTYGRSRTSGSSSATENFYNITRSKISNISKVVPTNMSTYFIGTNGGLSAAGYNFNGTLGNGVLAAGAQNGIFEILNSGVKDVKSLVTTSYAVGTNGLLSGWGYHASSTAGWLDNNGIRYNFITGAVSGIDGNIYVCDRGNFKIKKIDNKKNVTTFLNLGTSLPPTSITQDISGNFYVTSNHAILKITSDKRVTTFAGSSSTSGNVLGQGNVARFNTVRGITIDNNNNLYVCDSNNHSIKKITQDGTVTLFAGSSNRISGNIDFDPNVNFSTTAINTDFKHNLFLKNNGTVWSVGNNSSGQLGDASTTNRSTLVQVSGLTNVTAIDAGDDHSLFLKNDGTVWSVGNNGSGRLGDGTAINKSTPGKVSGLTNITAIAAGSSHSLFLKNDGTVWSCGYNFTGQLGIGSTTTKSTPVQITSLSNITAIAAGASYSLFLENDGTVWSVGSNNFGQLGDGTTTSKSTPVQITSLSNITAIAAGGYHSLFLRSDGTVWGIGYNSLGQLGDGTTTNKSTPVQITSLSNITAIAGGDNHSLFLRSDGTVWSVGNNAYGTLGDGTTTNRSTPVEITSLSNVTAIAGGEYHSLFLKNDGTVWSCGYNDNGQLGDGTTVNKSTPIQVEEPSARFNLPRSITIDTSNNDLFIADTNNHTVRRITSNRVVTTIAGVAGSSGNTIGFSTGSSAAKLTSPNGIGYTNNGIYVNSGPYIRRITSTNVEAVVGHISTTKFSNGTGTNGLIHDTLGESGSIILIGTNDLLYTDTSNFCLRNINTTNNSIGLYSGSGGSSGDVISKNDTNQPKPIELPNAKNIDRIIVDGGQKIRGYGITTDKKVYGWGFVTSNKPLSTLTEPTLLELPPVKDIVISINTTRTTPTGVASDSRSSAYFIGDDGGLSAIGETYLGNGTNTSSDTFIKINIPPVKKVAVAGSGKIYALGEDGGLSAWGNNSDGFLGVSNTDTNDRLSPIKIDLPPIQDIYTTTNDIGNGTSVPAWTTVIVLGTNGVLSGWGQGRNLGFSDPKTSSRIPVKLNGFEPEVTGVYTSNFNTIVNYKTNKTSKSYNYFDNPTKIGTDTDWKIVDKHGDFAIKTNNTLWSISSTPYQIGTDTDYENVFYGTPVKINDPYDIKISTKKYFTSTDMDELTVLQIDKPERTIINLRENNTIANFMGISANTLNQNVILYVANKAFDTSNFKFELPSVIKY